jgi:type IV pilus assembly protein PilC
MDRVKPSAPLIGPPLLMAEMARFCRTISMLVGAGLPLQEILHLMPQTTGNSVMRDALFRVEEGLLLGQGISGRMATMDLFPPLLVQMVTVGEESNSLDSTLAVVADFYEVNAEERLTAMVGLITPAMTIGLSVGTGFVALSVIMPMYSIVGKF